MIDTLYTEAPLSYEEACVKIVQFLCSYVDVINDAINELRFSDDEDDVKASAELDYLYGVYQAKKPSA